MTWNKSFFPLMFYNNTLFYIKYIRSWRDQMIPWCSGYHVRLTRGRSWVQSSAGSDIFLLTTYFFLTLIVIICFASAFHISFFSIFNFNYQRKVEMQWYRACGLSVFKMERKTVNLCRKPFSSISSYLFYKEYKKNRYGLRHK